jgi:hypothetical protein
MAGIAGVALVVVGLAVLVGTQPVAPQSSPPGPSSPTPDLPSSDAALIGASVCALQRQPGPDDHAPGGGGDLMDVADYGGGRWRMCLDAPVSVVAEGTAWCIWNDDRTAVLEVNGLPVDVGGGTKIDGSVQIRQPQAHVALTSANGDVTSYVDHGHRSRVEPANGGTSGAAAFALDQYVDPEHPPALKPPGVSGTIRWACGQPPAPRPGRAVGAVQLQLDVPVGHAWQVATRCDWVSTAAGPRVVNVETSPPDIDFNDRFVGVQVEMSGDAPTVAIWIDEHDQGGSYASTAPEFVIPLAIAGDGSSGQVRIRHLPMDSGVTVAIVPGADEVSGIVSWTCRPPAAPGPKGQPRPAPGPAADPGMLVVSGHATVTVDPPVTGPIDTPVTCLIDTSDPAYLRVAELTATFGADGRTVRLSSDGGRILLILISQDGSPHGEYIGQITRIGDQADRGPLVVGAPEVAFEPIDPRYVPFDGPSGPRTIGVQIDYACDVAPASPAP